MHPGLPPSTRGARMRRRRATPGLTLLVLLVGAGLVPRWAPAQEQAPPLEPALIRCLQEIEAAFRTGDAARLRGVLPREAKVLVGLETFSRHKAFYAPEQVVILFQKIFRDFRPVSFEIHRESGSRSEDDAYFVPASWTAETRDSIRSCRLRLMVRREGSGFTILQIKETHGIR